MTPQDIEQLLGRPKIGVGWTGWEPRFNHAGHLIGIAELFEHGGTSIPGVTLELQVKAAAVSPSCLYTFSVMRLHGRERKSLYRLEVAPKAKRTHNGVTPLYGPHEHVGDEGPGPVIHADVDCGLWGGCLRWFLTRVGVVPFEIQSPF